MILTVTVTVTVMAAARYPAAGTGVRSGVERSGPPDGSLARVAQTGRVAAGGVWQTTCQTTLRIGGFPGESVATDLPGSAHGGV